MGPNGERAHKLFETSDERWLGGLHWSRDGRHVTYGDCDKNACAIVSRDLAGSHPILLGSWPPEQVTGVSSGTTLACSKLIGGSCVIAERTPDQAEIVFSALNPVSERGRELARISAGPEPHPWALSQDGTAIAVHADRSNHFDLISIKTGRRKSLELQGWSALGPVSWSAHGDGLFVSALSGPDALIVYIGLNGKARVIWRQTGDFGLTAVPSPDSRLLAVTRWRNSSNVWMIDNF
jgi:hypothetical protein